MYVLLVYDINEKRVNKALKTCRRYLHWIQNSVFEGEITAGKLAELLSRLKKIIKKDEDSVLIFKFASEKLFEKQIMGVEKAPTGTFIQVVAPRLPQHNHRPTTFLVDFGPVNAYFFVSIWRGFNRTYEGLKQRCNLVL